VSTRRIKNISLFQKYEIGYRYAIPHPQEGRYAIVTSVGRGMRWTQRLRETSAAGADGEIVRS
jgi:hypothetical protein